MDRPNREQDKRPSRGGPSIQYHSTEHLVSSADGLMQDRVLSMLRLWDIHLTPDFGRRGFRLGWNNSDYSSSRELNPSVREQSAVFFTPLQRFTMTALELIACE